MFRGLFIYVCMCMHFAESKYQKSISIFYNPMYEMDND